MDKAAHRRQAVEGPLASHAAGYRLELIARGYSPSAVRLRLWQLDHVSRWLEREDLSAGELTAAVIERFLAARRAAGYRTWLSPRSMVLPLGYLRAVGAVAPAALVVADGPVEEVLVGYRRYLLSERGLTVGTVADYQRIARLFLEQTLAGGEIAYGQLTAGEVTAFLARECPVRPVASAKYLVCGLRSLLRYLHLVGVTSVSLADAVPGVAAAAQRIPRAVAPAIVARLLAGCDRRRTVGRRDYAILLLLSRLGLRAGEIAALRLDDVDWRAGELLVRGKGDRHERLPMPADVGAAIVSYLQRRGGQDVRELFVRVNAPAGALRSSAVGAVVHDACVRVGIEAVRPHRLRHTAATGMLRAGASLPEIAEVLRHHRLETTTIYAKVDRDALRALASAWPGGAA